MVTLEKSSKSFRLNQIVTGLRCRLLLGSGPKVSVGREWSYNFREDWDLPCRSNDPQIELNYPLDQLFSNGEQFPNGNNLT